MESWLPGTESLHIVDAPLVSDAYFCCSISLVCSRSRVLSFTQGGLQRIRREKARSAEQ